MTLATQLHAALSLTVTKSGHLPYCNHRAWLGGYGIRQRHACDLDGCDGEGVPCIPRCLAVRRALRAGEAAIPVQAHLPLAPAAAGLGD